MLMLQLVCLYVAAGGYGSCRSDEFMCSHPRRCITQRWVCDLDRDCEDGSDETDCRMSALLAHLCLLIRRPIASPPSFYRSLAISSPYYDCTIQQQ